MKLTKRSLENLVGVHPDLVRVVEKAAEQIGMRAVDGFGFVVTEGVRTAARQLQLVSAGASRTTKSRHITGHAVDLACTVYGEVRWDWPLYWRLARVMKDAARRVGVKIEWGGDWKLFKDGPHFQLPEE